MDLLLGCFADRWLERLDATELAQFEEILEIADPILYSWLCGRSAPPQSARTNVMDLLLDFHTSAFGSGMASSCGQA